MKFFWLSSLLILLGMKKIWLHIKLFFLLNLKSEKLVGFLKFFEL